MLSLFSKSDVHPPIRTRAEALTQQSKSNDPSPNSKTHPQEEESKPQTKRSEYHPRSNPNPKNMLGSSDLFVCRNEKQSNLNGLIN
jgi:hypothetical protein